MAAIERTAYPTWPAGGYHVSDIQALYTPTKEEMQWVERSLRHSPGSKKTLVAISTALLECIGIVKMPSTLSLFS